jgi:hypothetical protein
MTTPEPFDVGSCYGSCQIGLYQPMLNRFLLTTSNIEHARDIMFIASGRYPLFLVNLVTADNYHENLIDNLCCENWKLPHQQIVETSIKNYANFIVNAQHLLPIVRHDDPFLSEEKHYLQLCWHYLKLLDRLRNRNIHGWRIKQFMSDIFDFQENQHDTVSMHVQNLKKQIIVELYLCKDTHSVRDSIENIIAKAKEDHDLVL